MNSITSPTFEYAQTWLQDASDRRSPTLTSSDSANEVSDWQDAAARAHATFLYVIGVSNRLPEIESNWWSLAKAAQKRWFKENPF